MVQIVVDDKPVETRSGQSVLQACLQVGIYIPNLCFITDDDRPSASCRLCFVEIEGQPAPVTACTHPVADGLRIRTHTKPVRRLQRSALKLLLSVHCVECKICPANRACALQQIARFLKVALNSKPLEQILKPVAVDQSHPFIDHLPNRCVLCGKCIRTCRDHGGYSMLTFYRRGFETVIRGFDGGDQIQVPCADCSRCIEACPVGALQMRMA
jgi:NADH dehydrogenase/NADH:ubiquinone oxidoreductase subunit G